MTTRIRGRLQSHRPLRLRMRGDLSAVRQRIGGQVLWVVKDPVALEYFHLGEEEFSILQWLDGQRTAAQVRCLFESRFPPQKLEPAQLQWFLSRLHSQGLVVSDVPGQGQQLLNQREQQRRGNRWYGLWQLLAIRFRGIDPEPWLKRLERRIWWVFTPPFLVGCLLMLFAAVVLVTSRFESAMTRLPGLTALLTSENLALFAVALFAVKVLHELGHALACKHFGGECHEIGLMLLVCMPCLYCNVSDSWRLPDKWQRAAVSAAGIFVEMLLAALCTFVWWFTAPGALHAIALNVMLLCSVSTLLLNGNPLLRYDGYYVLADLWEMPNLAERAREQLRRMLLGLCLGIEIPSDDPVADRRRVSLSIYALLACVYRAVVLLAVVSLCYTALKPWRMEKLALALGMLVLCGLVVVPTVRNVRWLGVLMTQQPVRRGRIFITCTLLAGSALAVFALPMPFRVSADVVLEPAAAHRLYVPVSGQLVRALPPGTRVEAGDVIAELQNDAMHLELVRLRGEVRQQRTRLQNLEARRNADPGAAQQIPGARERLDALAAQLEKLRQDHEKLLVRAPVSGTVLPPPRRTDPPPPDRLRDWRGSPLDARNVGCTLQAGTLVCLVGDVDTMEAAVSIAETEMDYVQPGQHVELLLQELPLRRLTGAVAEIAKIEQKQAARPSVPNLASLTSESRPGLDWRTAYQARVRLHSHTHPLTVRATGRARIHVEDTSLGVRCYRAIRRVLGFRL